MLSEIFWMALLTTSAGVVIKLASMCQKSKCKECVMCGGRIKIIRDTELEAEIELSQPSQKQDETKE